MSDIFSVAESMSPALGFWCQRRVEASWPPSHRPECGRCPEHGYGEPKGDACPGNSKSPADIYRGLWQGGRPIRTLSLGLAELETKRRDGRQREAE
jgi:hypothetical protein